MCSNSPHALYLCIISCFCVEAHMIHKLCSATLNFSVIQTLLCCVHLIMLIVALFLIFISFAAQASAADEFQAILQAGGSAARRPRQAHM